VFTDAIRSALVYLFLRASCTSRFYEQHVHAHASFMRSFRAASAPLLLSFVIGDV